MAEVNRIAGESGELHALLEQQVYRLAYWRAADDEINYRLFFDINDLAGLRVEDEKVFDFTQCNVTAEPTEGSFRLRVRDPLKQFPLAILSGVVE